MLIITGSPERTAGALDLSLPGGRRIRLDQQGILRIQWQPQAESLPPVPPPSTTPLPSTLASIEVRDTGTSKGHGAFWVGRQPLPRHTFLGFYSGKRINSRDELDVMYDDGKSMDYVMSVDGGATFLDAFERAQDRSRFSPVHLNHQDREQGGCNCVRVLQDGQVAFFTSREVKTGEELCFDYGSDYWKGRENEKI